jgi:hypothetical protein
MKPVSARALSRRSSLFYRITLAITLGILCVLFVAGCDSAEEASYKSRIASIETRLIEVDKQFGPEYTQFVNQMNGIAESAKTTEWTSAYANWLHTLDAYMPQYQTRVGQIQPPATLSNEHRMYVNAINTMTISWQNLGQGIQKLKTADMYGGLARAVYCEKCGSILKDNYAFQSYRPGREAPAAARKGFNHWGWVALGVVVIQAGRLLQDLGQGHRRPLVRRLRQGFLRLPDRPRAHLGGRLEVRLRQVRENPLLERVLREPVADVPDQRGCPVGWGLFQRARIEQPCLPGIGEPLQRADVPQA